MPDFTNFQNETEADEATEWAGAGCAEPHGSGGNAQINGRMKPDSDGWWWHPSQRGPSKVEGHLVIFHDNDLNYCGQIRVEELPPEQTGSWMSLNDSSADTARK